jgi:hypothetical protein
MEGEHDDDRAEQAALMSLDAFDIGATVDGQTLSFGTGQMLLLGGQPLFGSEFVTFTPAADFRFFETPGVGAGFFYGGAPSLTGGEGRSLFDAPSFGAGQVQDDVLLGSIRQALADPATREVLNRVGVDTATGKITGEPGVIAQAVAKLKSAIGEDLFKGLGVLGLGAVGIALGQAVVGGGERMRLPEPTPPSPATQASREALNTALTQPGTVRSATGFGAIPGFDPTRPFVSDQATLAAQAMRQQQVEAALTQHLGRSPTQQEVDQAMQALPAPRAPSVAAGPSLAQALGPGATGQEDLQTAFRLGLAGQRNLADLALAGTGRELAADIEQSPWERAIRLGALGEVPGLLGPTGNLAPALSTGQTISRSIADLLRPGTIPMRQDASGQWVADVSSPSLPAVLQDPVRAALEAEVLRTLRGETPTPELEQAEREEEAQLRNRLFRMLGPGFELSTTGDEQLQRLKTQQQIRRNQYRVQSVANLAPQELQRRQFGEEAPLNRLRTFLPAELERATFGENVRQRGLTERVALADLGRRPVSQLSTTLQSIVPTAPLLGLGDAESERRFQQGLQTDIALRSFDAEQRERAARAQGISSLFGTAAGTAFAPSSVSLRLS